MTFTSGMMVSREPRMLNVLPHPGLLPREKENHSPSHSRPVTGLVEWPACNQAMDAGCPLSHQMGEG